MAQIHEPVQGDQQVEVQPPKPVIFHDGGLMKRPTPANALIILLWFPFGIILSVRSLSQCGSYLVSFCRVTVKGKPPPKAGNSRGVLFVCNHRRTMIDPLVISYALGRSIPAVLISELLRFYDILSPVPIVRFTRNRDVDAVVMMEKELSKGDLMYEITFLDQLPLEATCSSGNSPFDVANHVQRILAETLGFECTQLGRKAKYNVLT
ncbi:hypothetical protein HID58_068454 [Brassica napus]|uniref:Phospholipid/glycerol acyltransferase domain-containing protein n=1 Tax=Brassica napus TaxID=3708 RepID=A0ABQ7ZLD7_BRANA|nr:glycerol-3-phosphate acyltransferase 5-like [Brassica napus]KAH0881060.1 hypothetical protein HID58_068454 [Brassica napus]